mmetsp:Transcript_14328/g.47537  ORF Transcript_14328/g.47537 Transcript_14328/m.47537 type:complete len:232 (+) Transcript_14328:246-941(+)
MASAFSNTPRHSGDRKLSISGSCILSSLKPTTRLSWSTKVIAFSIRWWVSFANFEGVVWSASKMNRICRLAFVALRPMNSFTSASGVTPSQQNRSSPSLPLTTSLVFSNTFSKSYEKTYPPPRSLTSPKALRALSSESANNPPTGTALGQFDGTSSRHSNVHWCASSREKPPVTVSTFTARSSPNTSPASPFVSPGRPDPETPSSKLASRRRWCRHSGFISFTTSTQVFGC